MIDCFLLMKKLVYYVLIPVVVSALLLFGYKKVKSFKNTGRALQTEGKMRLVMDSLKAYATRAGQFPTEAQGLQALVEEPTMGPVPERWEASFETIPRDGWEQEFVYKLHDSSSGFYENLPEIISKGSDGVLATADDLSLRFSD